MTENIFKQGRKIRIRLCLLLYIAMLTLGVRGQNYTRPNIMGPDGLQVNSYTGNLFTQRTDLSIPGRGLSVKVMFSYNTTDKDTDYGFGYGWNLNYNEFYKDTSGGLLFTRADGRKDFFGPTVVAGGLVASKGIFDKLSAISGGYLLTKKDGTGYYFENAGNKKLTRIRDRNGNEINLLYSGDELTTITDASGRTVTLTWSGTHLQSLTSAASAPARTVSYSYSDASCLTSVRDAAGYTTQYLYAPGRLLNGLTDGNGNTNQVVYNSNNAVVKLSSCLAEKSILYSTTENKVYVTDQTNSKREQTVYTFDADGKLIGRTGNCCGYSNAYGYDANNDINRIVDAAGNATVYGYDGNGNLLSETDPSGRSMRYTYENVFNQVTGITDKNGNRTSFTYDAKGNLTAASYPLGITVKYTYDDKGNLGSVTDGRGNVTAYGYDNYGDIVSVKDAAGNTAFLTYDGVGDLLTRTDANGHTTSYSYDQLGRPATVTDALNGVSRYNYDAHSNITGLIDPNNNNTTLVYDPYDKLVMRKDALGNTVTALYDGLGNILSSTDANGHTTGYGSDNLNRVTSMTNAAGETVNYSYDGRGNRVSAQYPNGNTVNTQYDVLSRVTQVSDNLGIMAIYTYDANSNKLSQTDGKGNTITYRYDALNRLVSKADPSGGVYLYVYDANGNLLKETDRNGNSTVYTYDVLNRLQTVTNPIGAVTAYAYDNAGNQTSVTDANGNRTGYTYDELNRKTVETFADNTSKRYSYDRIGHLTGRTDNKGQVTQYRYDNAYRLLYRVYPNSVDSFTYDNEGKMLSANNAQARVSFGYDVADRLSFEMLNGKQTQYGYNIAAGIKTIIYPSGRTIQRQLDARNQLTSISENGLPTPLVVFAYDGAGQNIARQFANGGTNTLSYNGKGNISGYTDAPLHTTDASYSYDKEDNPVSASYSHTASLSGQYSYDKTNQLTAFTRGGQQQTFNYDKVNNRLSANINGVAASYTVNNMNAYTSIVYGGNTITPVYDGNGNMTNDGARNYDYDVENRVTSVNGTVARYTYDALGRRIQKVTAADTVDYYFSGRQVIEERDAHDMVAVTYTWGNWVDDIVVMQRNGGTYYYSKNIIGSVLSITDAAGALAERYEYDAFGRFSVFDKNNALLAGSSIGNVYTFTGREYDTETGLYYYRARYYDALHGRFLERDPLDYINSLDLYAYVNNMPLKFTDATGANWIDNNIDNPYIRAYGDADLSWLRSFGYGLIEGKASSYWAQIFIIGVLTIPESPAIVTAGAIVFFFCTVYTGYKTGQELGYLYLGKDASGRPITPQQRNNRAAEIFGGLIGGWPPNTPKTHFP